MASDYVVINGHELNCARNRHPGEGEECDCLEPERCDECGTLGHCDCDQWDDDDEA